MDGRGNRVAFPLQFLKKAYICSVAGSAVRPCRSLKQLQIDSLRSSADIKESSKYGTIGLFITFGCSCDKLLFQGSKGLSLLTE